MVKQLSVMVFVLGISILGYLVWRTLDQQIKTVVVSGEPTAAERMRVQAVLTSVELQGILSTDLTQIEERLNGMGWTREVAVRRHWPDRLEVNLHKIVPVARWGRNGYLAADGVPIELPDQYADIPTLSARISTPQQTMELFRLLQLFSSRQNLQISMLTETPQGEWLVKFASGLQVHLGAYDVSNRMQRFLRAYRLELRKQGRTIEYADARYTSGIAVRFKPEPVSDEKLAKPVASAILELNSKPKNNGS